MQHATGRISMIRCQWDGYPHHVGLYLYKYYPSLAIVEELISYGNLISIDTRIHPYSKKHTYNDPEPGVCIYFARDSGREDSQVCIDEYADMAEYENAIQTMPNKPQYQYLFHNERWYLNGEWLKSAIKRSQSN